MRIRRRNPCFIEVDDTLMPDFASLLRGDARLGATVSISLLCPIGGNRISLTGRQLGLVARLSANQWHEVATLAAEGVLSEGEILELADRGAVTCDAGTPSAKRVRAGESRLADVGWHPHAAIYHAMTQWRGVEGEEGRRDHADIAHRERLGAHAATHGTLPSHFHRRDDALARHALPTEALDDPFGRTLRARCTTRHFDTTVALSLADVTRVLYGTFGVMGSEELASDVVALKRTSASGGALHPIEAYPLVIKVEGLAPGLYHYEGSSHCLALLEAMTEPQARELAAALTIGQTYFAEAHALVFHVARLDRHHWKYRRHPKAYKAVLLDSGHLSQTFYLLAAERGLGAFYTAAVNDADAGSRLKLDALSEIVIGASGLGIVDPRRNQLHLRPEPHEPERVAPSPGNP
jgi:putative peptide maturation dehydrogenase